MVIFEEHKVFNETRNNSDFLTNTGDFTTTIKGNVGEKLKVFTKLRFEWNLKANTLTSDTLTVAAVSGGFSMSSILQNFETEGFRVGDVFDFIDTPATPVLYAGQIITLVSGNYIEFTNTGTIPAASYTDAETHGVNSLDTLDYEFNLTDSNDPNNLTNSVFGIVQSYKFSGMITAGADVPGVAKFPFYWQSGTGTARKLANVNTYQQVYEVETVFVIPFYSEGQLINLQEVAQPVPFNANTQFLAENFVFASGTDATTEREFNLIRSINDSVGYFNENFDGGARNYSAVSIDYEELATGAERTRPEITETTKVTAVFAANGTTFLTTDPATFAFSYLPTATDSQDNTNDFNTLWNFESLRGLIDGGAVSGTIITNLDLILDSPTQITATFELQFTADQKSRMFEDGNFILSASFEDSAAAVESANRLNLLLDVNTISKNTDISGLFAITKDEIYYHPDTFTKGVTTGTTDLIEWNEGNFLRDIEFKITTGDAAESAEIVTLQDLKALIIAYNPTDEVYFIIQSVTIPTPTNFFTRSVSSTAVQQLNTDTTRGFLLTDSDPFNFLKLSTDAFVDPLQTYSLQIGLMVDWQYWQALGADPVFYNVAEPNNGLNKETSNYSDLNGFEIRLATLAAVEQDDIVTDYLTIGPKSEVFDFDLDKNVSPLYTNDIVIEDVNAVDIGNTLLRDEDNTVIATFDDGTTKASIADFESIVRLEVFEQGQAPSKHIISSIYGVIEGDILKQLTGDTLLNKSLVGGNYTAKCLIDGEQLVNTKYSITAALYDLAGVIVNKISQDFNGINQSVNFAVPVVNTQSVTIAAWIKPASFSESNIIGNQGSSNLGAGLMFVGTNLTFLLGDGTNDSYFNNRVPSTSSYITLGSWHHILGTWDGTTSTIYIDGVLRFTWNPGLPHTISYSPNFRIARRPDFGSSGFNYSGQLDNGYAGTSAFILANVTAMYSQGQCGVNYSALPGAVSHWLMDTANPPDQISSNNGTGGGTITIESC